MTNDREFLGSTVVVTGAAGIHGRWIASAFAREGACLCLSDMRQDALEQTAAELGLDPATTLLHATELTDEASVLSLAETVRAAWGAPDVVVNNAGVYPRNCQLMTLPVAEWDRIFDVNLRAPFLVSREMARLMMAAGKGGSIVNIGSGAARQMRRGSVPYCTSKMALERLTKGLALELAAANIRVNVVEPGFAPGSSVSALTPDYVANMNARIPLGRSSGEHDASEAVLFLCSSRAAYITGTAIAVDGGNSIGTHEPAKT